MPELKGQLAIVTGASSGLGEATAVTAPFLLSRALMPHMRADGARGCGG